MSRPSNADLCVGFRDLLTDGFYVVNSDGQVFDSVVDPERERGLQETKRWRGEVWKAFRELEDRLCPTQKFARTGQP